MDFGSDLGVACIGSHRVNSDVKGVEPGSLSESKGEVL